MANSAYIANADVTLYAVWRVDECTVEFVDYSRFFSVPETKGVRLGNVLTVQATNKTGDYTFDIRIEIHEGKILVIHNLHHHDEPCTYSTITFSYEEE